MIKRLSLLMLCAFAVSHDTQAMNADITKKLLVGTAAGVLSYLALRQGYRWWRLRLFKQELARNPSVLHGACESDDLEKVAALIDAGAPLDAQDNEGRTPLHYASWFNYKEIAEFLIKHGAPLDAQEKYGRTPLHWALSLGRKEVAELLIEHGASFDAQDTCGRIPLYYASFWGYDDISRLLVCASFFPPRSLRSVRAAQSNLQELCLMALNKANEDVMSKHIIPYMAQHIPLDPMHTNFVQLISDCAPLKVQQALVTYWQKQAARNDTRQEALNNLNLFIKAHCDRHLKKVQAALKIRTEDNETLWYVALIRGHKNIVALLDNLEQATTFDKLDPALKKAITESIKDRLF